MKVCVSVNTLEFPEFEKVIQEHVSEHWATNCTVISQKTPVPKDAEALLIVGRKSQIEADSILIVDHVNLRGSVEELLFQIDAKLGKLTHSDLIKTKVSLFSNPEQKFSRRDLFNFKSGLQTYSDAPFVFTERCDAKLGCSKCVEVCPAKSLSISGGLVLVNDVECVRCGLCAENCPTSAIQLPKFSEDAFMGLIDGLNMADAPKKTLVLTCNSQAFEREPWMCVEEVRDVGIIGPRHLALAASSSVGAVAIYCVNGRCYGKDNAKQAVELVRDISREEESPILAYAEGPQGFSEVHIAHALSRSPKEPSPFARKSWQTYIGNLKAISREDALAAGLRLTSLTVSDACTLCGVCARECPHSALKATGEALLFDSANCTGCTHCGTVCPEHAITLGRLDNISDLHQVTVFRDELVLCARCGKPLESAKFLKKIAMLVGTEDPMIKYCNDCKQRLAFESLLKRGKVGGK